MNLSAPPRLYDDRWDRWTIRVGFALVAVIAAVQHHQHTGFFYTPNAASPTREVTSPTSGERHSYRPTHPHGGVPARRPGRQIGHSVSAAGDNRAHLAAGVRLEMAGRRLHRPLRIHGRRTPLQRHEPRAVADQRGSAPVGVSLEGRP